MLKVLLECVTLGCFFSTFMNTNHKVSYINGNIMTKRSTLWLVFKKVEKKQPKVTHSSKTFNISHETKVNLENLVQLTSKLQCLIASTLCPQHYVVYFVLSYIKYRFNYVRSTWRACSISVLTKLPGRPNQTWSNL